MMTVAQLIRELNEIPGHLPVHVAVKADGSTACTEKFTAGGTVRVRVWYSTPVAAADVA